MLRNLNINETYEAIKNAFFVMPIPSQYIRH